MNLTKKQLNNFWKNVEKTDNCWNWKGHSQKGYGRIYLSGKVYKVHRISLFISGIDLQPLKKDKGSKGSIVMHTCDNTLCVNPKHLKLTTQLENMIDARQKGRKYFGETRGEGNPNAKLTWREVNIIRNTNMSRSIFKEKYSFLSPQVWCDIINFKSWIPA